MRKSYQAKRTDKQKLSRGNVVFQGTKKTSVKGRAGEVGKNRKAKSVMLVLHIKVVMKPLKDKKGYKT